ncbi:transcriptional regulator with XRE-family HTH domain [Aminobacter niigataensis]|uniref:Transcriptional regulator with XRE-family HTH domain n=1 Tax=Aminobacter niigataensis TaxID=83265 RepID=A0ABR6L195_9HYPH|nr:transcriptional regulator with XRE-family HTH domain [Aminobacter niigataensis]
MSMSQLELASAAGIAPTSVKRSELNERVAVRTLEALRRALEGEGVVFVASSPKHGPGMRLQSAPSELRLLVVAAAALGWSVEELAARSGIGERTLVTARTRDRAQDKVSPATLVRVREALERAGVRFLPPTSDYGPGLTIPLEILSRQDLRF